MASLKTMRIYWDGIVYIYSDTAFAHWTWCPSLYFPYWSFGIILCWEWIFVVRSIGRWCGITLEFVLFLLCLSSPGDKKNSSEQPVICYVDLFWGYISGCALQKLWCEILIWHRLGCGNLVLKLLETSWRRGSVSYYRMSPVRSVGSNFTWSGITACRRA